MQPTLITDPNAFFLFFFFECQMQSRTIARVPVENVPAEALALTAAPSVPRLELLPPFALPFVFCQEFLPLDAEAQTRGCRVRLC